MAYPAYLDPFELTVDPSDSKVKQVEPDSTKVQAGRVHI
jgi:hypothetical protein